MPKRTTPSIVRLLGVTKLSDCCIVFAALPSTAIALVGKFDVVPRDSLLSHRALVSTAVSLSVYRLLGHYFIRFLIKEEKGTLGTIGPKRRQRRTIRKGGLAVSSADHYLTLPLHTYDASYTPTRIGGLMIPDVGNWSPNYRGKKRKTKNEQAE